MSSDLLFPFAAAVSFTVSMSIKIRVVSTKRKSSLGDQTESDVTFIVVEQQRVEQTIDEKFF